MELYGALSTRTDRCLWALAEAGATYTFHLVDPRAGAHRQPEFLSLNPNGKVPVLKDGSLVLFESAAICLHVADTYPSSGLAPGPRSPERALLHQWLFWVATELEQPLWTLSKHRFALPEKLRVPAMLEIALKEWTRPAAVLADALEGRAYLVGDRFTVADIMAAHTLLWARVFEVPLGHDVLESYLDRMIARPAFSAIQRHRR